MFGFLSTLLSLLELHPSPTHVAVVFDASGKTFRHELFPGYKGQRPDTPEDIRAAVPKLQELLNAMGIVELCVPGVEADDVIGTVAVRSVEAGMAVAIASPDKDFFQLLRPGLILLRPPKKADAAAAVAAGASKAVKYALQPYTDDKFRDEWQGLEPHQFIDLLALMGDASDNVPGVEGIGPKTATSLLLRYGTLDEILHQAGDIIPKKRATAMLATSEGAAAAKLSRQLVEIRVDLDLPPVVGSLEKFRVRPPRDGGKEALRLLKELEFEMHSTRIQALWKRMQT
jgi:5'-3' exonuclease